MFSIDLTRYRIIDLSFEVIPGESDDRPFDMQLGYLADNAFKYDITRTHTHVGTHVETPAHFFEGGKSITDLPLEAFYGRAILLPICKEAPDLEITIQDLEQAVGDIIQSGDIVVCRNDNPGYRDLMTKERLYTGEATDLPYFTAATARWFRDHKVKMLVLDWIRLGLGIPEGREFHDILMREDVTFVEFASNLADLKQREFFVMALPFKVRGIDSGWARVIAIEER